MPSKTNTKKTKTGKGAAADTAKVQAPKEKPRTRGVVLLALGNPEYGKMAWNLLVTIRASDKDTPVAIVHNHTSISHLSANQLGMFQHQIVCPVDYYTHQGKAAYVKPKVFLYDLSPFDDTLFMDCDVAMMPDRKVSDLMTELAGVDFTIKNTGRYNIAEAKHEGNAIYGYGGWKTAKLPELAKLYRLKEGFFYQVQGEVFWFKKGLRTKALFAAAQRAFTHQKAVLVGGFAGQNMNDELAFIIAMACTSFEAHIMPWTPTYWYLLEPNGKNPDRGNVMGSYWMLSAGGNSIPASIESFYNDIVKRASFALQVPYLFAMKRKSSYLPERRLF